MTDKMPARGTAVLVRAALFSVLVMELLLLIAVFPLHNYDVPTAMFFTLSLGFFQRGRLLAYACLFPFACLNRETTILLTVLFAVYFFRRLDRGAYLRHLLFQFVVYVGIYGWLRWRFAGFPGQAVYFDPLGNLQMYAQSPIATIIFLVVVAVIAWLVVAHWRRAPALMRTAFLVFAPILFVLFFLVGRSFEISFFIELVPVVAVIGTS